MQLLKSIRRLKRKASPVGKLNWASRKVRFVETVSSRNRVKTESNSRKKQSAIKCEWSMMDIPAPITNQSNRIT